MVVNKIVHIPKSKRLPGMSYWCKNCRSVRSETCGENGEPISKCDHANQLCWKSTVWLPDKTTRSKLLTGTTKEELFEQAIAFKKKVLAEYRNKFQGFNAAAQTGKLDYKDISVDGLIAKFMAFLSNENVHKQKQGHRNEKTRNEVLGSLKHLVIGLKNNKQDTSKLKAANIDDDHVEMFYKYIEDLRLGNRMYNKLMSHARRCWQYGIDHLKIAMPNIFNTVETKPLHYEPVAFPHRLLDPLLEVVKKENGEGKDKNGWKRDYYYEFVRDAFLVASETGLRRDELTALKYSNIIIEKDGRACIKIENMKVNAIEGRSGTNLKYTYVPISNRLLNFLEGHDYKNKIGNDEFIIAPDVIQKREEFLPNIFTKSFTHFIQHIPHDEKLNFKSFRKSFITAVAMKFNQAIAVTGHSNPKTILTHYVDKKQVALGMFNQPLYRDEEREIEVEKTRESNSQKNDKQIER
jgi:integrase